MDIEDGLGHKKRNTDVQVQKDEEKLIPEPRKTR